MEPLSAHPWAEGPSGRWLLNLDADLELGALAAGRPYAPPRALRAQLRRWAARFAEGLPGGAALIDPPTPAALRGEREVSCFCPTPSALAALERLGLRAPEAPPPALLARVNERAFAYELGAKEGVRLPDLIKIISNNDINQLNKSNHKDWRFKRGFGMSGRAHRRIRLAALSEADRAWIDKSVRLGPLYAEPHLELLLEVGLHGRLERDGALRIGAPTVQRCDPGGAWQEARRARPGELTRAELAALRRAHASAAEALREAGYFGPFGVDAFRYRDPKGGRERFHPLSELNARYSMSYFLGMAEDGVAFARGGAP